MTCTRTDALAAGSSYPAITLTVNVNVNSPSLVTNIATVSGGGGTNTGKNAASDPTTVATADLTVAKTHTGSFVQGDTGKTYSITARNGGAASTNATVSVVDTLPAGLTATAIAGTGWTCTLGTLTCSRSDVLAAGASYPTIILTVSVTSDAHPSITNVVDVSGGGEVNTGNNQAADPTTIVTVPLIVVTRSDDRNNPTCLAGDCSLREAINTVNAADDVKTVQFSSLFNSPQTITLTNGQLAINKSMILVGKGANLTTVSGNNATRIFFIDQNLSDVTISGLTIANGNGSGNSGGGLRNQSTGTVNLSNCAFTNNSSSVYGGGLQHDTPGGGTLNITGCAFSGNTAQDGGAIKIEHDNVNVTNTTISGNTAATLNGGGININEGNLTITSSTIAGNTTGGGTGAVSNQFDHAAITTKNSIIAGNSGSYSDVSGSFVSNGYNFIGSSDGSYGFADGVGGDQVGTIDAPIDPKLGGLQDNGGPTQTHALMAGSPAIDKGKNFSGLATDQRGLTRPVDFDNTTYPNAAGGDGSDIGAYEAQPVAITSANTTTFKVGNAGTFTVTTSGTPAPTVTQTGTLPNGVTFDSATKKLSGTPAAGTGGLYPISFKATNGVGTDATQTFTLAVNQSPAITSANNATFTKGTAGTFTVIATGYPPPAIQLTSGSLPSGVNYAAGMGNLAGTPTVFGTFPLTFTAGNGVGSNAGQSFSLVVYPSAQEVKSGPKISRNAGGGFVANFIGNPGQQYTVQYVDFLPATSAQWNFHSFQTADANGAFSITIPAPSAGVTKRFYRAIIP